MDAWQGVYLGRSVLSRRLKAESEFCESGLHWQRNEAGMFLQGSRRFIGKRNSMNGNGVNRNSVSGSGLSQQRTMGAMGI